MLHQDGITARNGSEERRAADYTDEQLEAVRRTKKCKDYYEVLGRGPLFQQARPQQGQESAEMQAGQSYGVLLQLLPILLLVGMSFMSGFFVADPPYSLVRTVKYQYARKTLNLKFQYYVKENFMAEHKNNIYRIEMDVEAEHIANLQSSCFRERSYKESLLWRARSLRDADLEQRAREYQMPSCDKLTELSQA